MSKQFFFVAISVIVIAFHLIALYCFKQIFGDLPLPQSWERQFFGLLALSLILASLIPITQKRSLIWLILILRAVIVIIAGLPLGPYLGVEFALLASLIIEASTYTTIIGSLIYSHLMIVLVINFQLPILAWKNPLPAASFPELLMFCFYTELVIILSTLLNFSRNKQIGQKELNRKYKAAILQFSRVNLQLQEYATISKQVAKINERQRLAREIHDILGYTLTNLIMMMEAGKKISTDGKPEVKELFEKAGEQAHEGLIEVRRAVKALRPLKLNEEAGLKAIVRLVNSFEEATHIKIKLNLGDVPWDFGPEENAVIYRIVQEGITNALRHGKASEIIIFLFQEDEGIRIQMRDDGIGTSELDEGYGFLGISERIEKLDGKLHVSSKPKMGFLLSVWIPLKKEA